MASSSSAAAYSKKYDAFLSFRGSDVRRGFLSHLHKALLDQKIDVFVDDQLNRGEEISESLLKKIKESDIAIVIFSQNYAYSQWCLEELLKIAECRNSAGQIVIPVFYSVDPSDVQDLTGSYGDAMAQHKSKFDESMVESWGNVLKETASLSGLVSSNFNTDSSLIEEIVKHTLEKLNCLNPSDSDCDDGLVGIESLVKEVMLLLCGREDVCVVGIWGEGGIGKTTLARATFERIRLQFDTQCFVENVREKSDKFTADAIRKEVVSELFGTSDCNMSRKRLSRKKVILVLDDVSDFDQIKLIMRYKNDVGPGSRIIITSRDRHLLKKLGAKIYEVEKLNRREALQLFCLNAFNNKIPDEGYSELSERAVKYAEGLPLALEVLGSNLFQRSAEEWEDEFEKLKGTSDQKIHKILRISYDGLSAVDKEIFLDIACFFKGKMRHEVERLLDAPGSKIGIRRLAEKALISVSFGHIKMHDLIQQMAKDIICEKAPGERRWLWDPEDIHFLLTSETGTGAVRGIFLDTSKIGNINLSCTAFQKLYNLRYLNFYSFKGASARLHAPQGLQYLPSGLRYLHWDNYPCKSLPILAEKLVELVIFNSQLEELWDGVQNLPNLKKLDLSGSGKLIKVPDLSTASKLKHLCLQRCESLVELSSSLKYLSRLAELRLGHCSRLRSLPDNICNLESLWVLDVSYCGNLHGLPQDLGNLNSLDKLVANESGIKELPDSVCNLKACTELNVSGCANLHQLPQNFDNLQSLEVLEAGGSGIKELPDSICNLKAFTDLDVRGCLNLHQLPQNLGNLQSLDVLEARGSGIRELPDSICNLKACTQLRVGDCANLHQLPQNLGNLQSLEVLEAGGSGMKEIPSSINKLTTLMELKLHGSEGLILPPLTGSFPNLTTIELKNLGMSEFPIGLCSVTDLKYLYLDGNHFESIPESIQLLSYLNTLHLNNCKELKYLPESLKSLPGLNCLQMEGCTSLDQNQFSNIMNHFMVEFKKGRRKFMAHGSHPGSEVPENMTYKNEHGSSLSFSFKLLQHVPDQKLEFYGCLVSDRPKHLSCFFVNFLDESGPVLHLFSSPVDCGPGLSYMTSTCRHSSKKFGRDFFVKGREYAVEVQFYSRTGLFCSCTEGITKCGVIPLFDHQTVE